MRTNTKIIIKAKTWYIHSKHLEHKHAKVVLLNNEMKIICLIICFVLLLEITALVVQKIIFAVELTFTFFGIRYQIIVQ